MSLSKNIIIVIFTLFLSACSQSSGKNYGVKMPNDSTPKQAEIIIKKIMSHGFSNDFKQKFKNFDPKKHGYGFSIKTGDNQVYIIFSIKFTETPQNVDEMVNFGANKLELEVKNHFGESKA